MTADHKKDIMGKIKAPVEKVKATRDGHLFVRFADRNNLEKAKKGFESNVVDNITVK